MPAGSTLLPEDMNEILKCQSKRRRACYPCHQRKVGCDGGRPCKRCVDRDHPALCNYDPGQPRGRKRRAEDAEPWDLHQVVESSSWRLTSVGTGAREEESTPTARARVLPTAQSARRGSETIAATRHGDREEASGQSQDFLGSSSVPGFILDGVLSANANRSGTSQGELRSLLLPALGLQRTERGSKAEPIQKLPHVQRALALTAQGSEVTRMFQWYKVSVFPLNPHIIDITAFETELIAFLEDADLVKAGHIEAPSSGWLARFFAVLAAGTQFSQHSFEKRTADSRKYVGDAFACLHADFGYITPNASNIGTLSILITVLQNNLEAEVAWSYLGLASRLAQSIGLDGGPTATRPSPSLSDLNNWQAIVWQDSLLSMCLGRRPCTLSNATRTQEDGSQATKLDYRRAMYELAASSLAFVNEQNAFPIYTPSPSKTLEHASQLQRLLENLKPEIYRKDCSRSIADNTERLAFRLNLSCALATLLRSALEERPPWLAFPEEREEARKMCTDACIAAVDSFVGLHHVSVVAERSWSFMHNGLSCALILLLIDEGSRNERVRNLQKKLIDIVSTSSSNEDRASPLWGPHARILSVFKLLESTRSARLSAADGAQQPTSIPSGVGQGGPLEQETSDASCLPSEPGFSDMTLPQDDLQFLDFLNLPNPHLGDGRLIGMYDSILWGNNNFI